MKIISNKIVGILLIFTETGLRGLPKCSSTIGRRDRNYRRTEQQLTAVKRMAENGSDGIHCMVASGQDRGQVSVPKEMHAPAGIVARFPVAVSPACRIPVQTWTDRPAHNFRPQESGPVVFAKGSRTLQAIVRTLRGCLCGLHIPDSATHFCRFSG